jgi:hypothetical protein
MEQDQIKNIGENAKGNSKLPWVSPTIIAINTTAIQQQEDELMLQLLSNPDSFKFLTGSLPG